MMNQILHLWTFQMKCIFEVIKSYFKGSYDEPNLTLVDIPNEIYETSHRVVS